MIDENAYEREERRHEQEAHAHAEYPDACYICQEQGREDDE